jgi:hypothetical protein
MHFILPRTSCRAQIRQCLQTLRALLPKSHARFKLIDVDLSRYRLHPQRTPSHRGLGQENAEGDEYGDRRTGQRNRRNGKSL